MDHGLSKIEPLKKLNVDFLISNLQIIFAYACDIEKAFHKHSNNRIIFDVYRNIKTFTLKF